MDATDRFDPTANAGRRISRCAILLVYAAATSVVFATALIPPTFINWTSEDTIFTFTVSLQYFLAAQLALLCFWAVRAVNKRRLQPKHRSWLWIPVALSMLYACCDETLKIHKGMGTLLLNNTPFLPAHAPKHESDLVLGAYVIGALMFTVLFIRELWPVKQVRVAYFGGLALIVLAVLIDTQLVNTTEHPVLVYTEELAEFYAGTTFAVAFLLFLIDRSRFLLRHSLNIPARN